MHQEVVTIVSGLPRSGTSMMMKMLEAGGMLVLIDHIRTPDEDNPKGYYEFERVKQIEHDQAWLKDAKGKVVKMVAALLKHLPPGYRYKVVFMRRKMEEILASQCRMLARNNMPTDEIGDAKMAALFRRHLQIIEAWLQEQPNIDVLYVSYNETVQDPHTQAERLNQFLGDILDVRQMVNVVDPNLYRQQR